MHVSQLSSLTDLLAALQSQSALGIFPEEPPEALCQCEEVSLHEAIWASSCQPQAVRPVCCENLHR